MGNKSALATDPNDYREMRQIMAHVGYVGTGKKQVRQHRFAKLSIEL